MPRQSKINLFQQADLGGVRGGWYMSGKNNISITQEKKKEQTDMTDGARGLSSSDVWCQGARGASRDAGGLVGVEGGCGRKGAQSPLST